MNPNPTTSLAAAPWFRFQQECRRLGLPFVRTGTLAEAGMAPRGNATHVIVVAQTGGHYWERLERMRQMEANLDAQPDPLDTMTRQVGLRLQTLLGEACDTIHFPFDEQPIDFVGVGQALGMGRPSRLGILIHPEYGLWFAFRMLFVVQDVAGVLPSPQGSAEGEHPCQPCAAPCIRACPAGAIQGPVGEEKLDYPTSFRYRIRHPGTCVEACAARLACPVGPAYRYPDSFLAHSHRRAFAMGKAYFADSGE